MLPLETLARFVHGKSNISIAHLILVIFLLALPGCTNDGVGGPIISSLSTPTDAASELDSDQSSNSEPAHHDGDEDPIIAMTPTPMGVTAHLTWEPPPDRNVAGYRIYYRKQLSVEQRSEESSSEDSSSEELSACSYEEHQTVEAPPAIITGLEPSTQYLFAISAFNESESLCSNAILAVTPPAQS